MSLVLRPPGLAGDTLLLSRREIVARLLSPWLYVVATAICLMAWLYGAGFLHTFETESVLVTTDPLLVLDILIVMFLGVVLGLRLAASLAWEREHRTLEVLIVGPVSYAAIILSKFCVELCVLLLLTSVYILYLLVAQPLGAGVIGAGDALATWRMAVNALPLLTLGLLISAWMRSVRMAVVVYMSIVALLATIEAAAVILSTRPPDQLSLAEAYLHRGLQAVTTVLDPISAVARLTDLADGLTAQVSLSAMSGLPALLLTAATLAVATVVARIRGAL